MDDALFGYKPINEKHINVIKSLAEDRNSFVHYKWESRDLESANSDQKSRDLEFIKKVKLSVRYVKTYESNVLFDNKKGNLKNHLKRRIKRNL
jgi:hypothetical protein